MNKKNRPKPRRNKAFESTAASGAAKSASQSKSMPRHATGFLGVPKGRWPHIIIFLTIAIGGSYLWIILTNGMNIQRYTYSIIEEYDHDPSAFTQGLVYENGFLYESTGRYGQSNFRKVDLKTGKVVKEFELPNDLFGEGLTLMNDKFYLLTWKAEKGLIFDRDLNKIGEFEYEGQGWGLTHDGTNLIMSNGSPTITFINPDTFDVVRRITVRNGRMGQQGINELEFIKGYIFANVLEKSYILQIDPRNGEVVGRIELAGIKPEGEQVDVMNGIAVNSTTNKLLITGKYWPKVFEIDTELINE
jgi:glutamine cyclotransferase